MRRAQVEVFGWLKLTLTPQTAPANPQSAPTPSHPASQSTPLLPRPSFFFSPSRSSPSFPSFPSSPSSPLPPPTLFLVSGREYQAGIDRFRGLESRPDEATRGAISAGLGLTCRPASQISDRLALIFSPRESTLTVFVKSVRIEQTPTPWRGGERQRTEARDRRGRERQRAQAPTRALAGRPSTARANRALDRAGPGPTERARICQHGYRQKIYLQKRKAKAGREPGSRGPKGPQWILLGQVPGRFPWAAVLRFGRSAIVAGRAIETHIDAARGEFNKLPLVPFLGGLFFDLHRRWCIHKSSAVENKRPVFFRVSHPTGPKKNRLKPGGPPA